MIAFAVLALSILLVPTVKAINLGGVVKNERLKISPGESGKFALILWNSEEESYLVELDVKQKPDDWLVFIRPYKFLLNSSVGDEYIILPNSGQSVKASLVDVFVKPDAGSSGSHDVIISAKAVLPQEGITFLPEIQLKLTADVGEASIEQGEDVEEIESESKSLSEELIERTPTNFFYPLIIICILVISFIIYRYG